MGGCEPREFGGGPNCLINLTATKENLAADASHIAKVLQAGEFNIGSKVSSLDAR